jgi:hypothetical protein
MGRRNHSSAFMDLYFVSEGRDLYVRLPTIHELVDPEIR